MKKLLLSSAIMLGVVSIAAAQDAKQSSPSKSKTAKAAPAVKQVPAATVESKTSSSTPSAKRPQPAKTTAPEAMSLVEMADRNAKKKN